MLLDGGRRRASMVEEPAIDERFFSYRRSVHRKEPDYGRHVHAIALEGQI